MKVQKEVHTFSSSNKVDTITYYIYRPLLPPTAVLQLSHGMCEYVERYDHFIDFMTEHGILVCGNDHLGHKNSAKDRDGLGYFAPKDGWKYLYEDLAHMTQIIKEEYPELPIFLFGHSMGSFIARAYLATYGSMLDGAIICGTAGSNPSLSMGQLIIRLIKRVKGERYRSKFLDNLMFGAYNKKYTSVRTNKDWLTRDEVIVDRYRNDPYCIFTFTCSAFYDLSLLLSYVSSDAWYQKLPKKLPLFLISGSMDPVGDYGKGFREVAERLQKQDLTDFSYTLYPEYRHEILNELGKETVYEDVLTFINSHTC
ncbi:MAG: hypothetical protein PWP24_20 [Clostridiales bacterium]|nr:hypothetical protein [Clostridiales bacterium]